MDRTIRKKREVHNINPLVDVILAEMNENEEWLELNRDKAGTIEYKQAQRNQLNTITRLNQALDNHSVTNKIPLI